MQSDNYQFEVIFSPQAEGGFTVEVPDLPGCISEGESLEKAKQNIEEAIVLYLETLEERGLPLPEREATKILRMQITVLSSSRVSSSSENVSHV